MPYKIKIEGLRRSHQLNYWFKEAFVKALETSYSVSSIPNLMTYDPLCAESSANQERARALACGILITGSFVGVCFIRRNGLDEYHFGDVDMLDSIAACGEIDHETDGQYIMMSVEEVDASTVNIKNPWFLQLYSRRTNWEPLHCGWNSTLFRAAFGNPTRLPVTYEERRVTITSKSGEVVTLILKPTGPKGELKHRVFVKCDRCGKEVPAGRIHQHTC